MKLFTQEILDRYLAEDWVKLSLESLVEAKEPLYTSDKWLLEGSSKRCIFSELYGDLRTLRDRSKILDVGGGLSTFSSSTLSHLTYEVVDLFHHEKVDNLIAFRKKNPETKIISSDWESFEPSSNYDVIISNDLFPNVDQRLDEFLEKFIPCTREIRLSLTFFNERKVYPVKRIDGDEILYIRPWSGKRLWDELKPYAERIENLSLAVLESFRDSIFTNGRQICTITIEGDIDDR